MSLPERAAAFRFAFRPRDPHALLCSKIACVRTLVARGPSPFRPVPLSESIQHFLIRILLAALVSLPLLADEASAQQTRSQRFIPSAGEIDRRLGGLEDLIGSGNFSSLGQLQNSTQIKGLQQQLKNLTADIEAQRNLINELRLFNAQLAKRLSAELNVSLPSLEGVHSVDATEGILKAADGAGDEGDELIGRGSGRAGTGSSASGGGDSPLAAVLGNLSSSASLPSGGEASASAALEAAAAAAGGKSPLDPATEKASYDKALKTLRNGNYKEAAILMSAFLERHPDSVYADNARYWLGESYYGQRDYSRAASEFLELIRLHPDSTKLPDALLKAGFAYHELRDPDRARTYFERLIEEYSGSTSAFLARRRLLRMNRSQ